MSSKKQLQSNNTNYYILRVVFTVCNTATRKRMKLEEDFIQNDNLTNFDKFLTFASSAIRKVKRKITKILLISPKS